jgi:hypothetical protein
VGVYCQCSNADVSLDDLWSDVWRRDAAALALPGFAYSWYIIREWQPASWSSCLKPLPLATSRVTRRVRRVDDDFACLLCVYCTAKGSDWHA